MVVAEIAVVPVGAGVDMSQQVQAAIDAIGKRRLVCKPTAMGTNVEGDLDEIFAAAKDAYQACLNAGARRALLELRVDGRTDKEQHLGEMEAAVH